MALPLRPERSRPNLTEFREVLAKVPPVGAVLMTIDNIIAGKGGFQRANKDAIVLCICAEASFWSAALERPHSAKIIPKMTPIARRNILGRASVSTPSAPRAKSNRSASRGSKREFDDS
jgi:hypothetical protein